MRAQRSGKTLSVRISQDEERLLRQIARRKKSSVSKVIREAVMNLADAESSKRSQPYDEIADLVGSIPALPPDLSERTGERFAQILREKARRR